MQKNHLQTILGIDTYAMLAVWNVRNSLNNKLTLITQLLH